MRIIFSLAAIAVLASATLASAQTAKRKTSPAQNQGASSSTAYADPANAFGNYPDWARRAFAARGGQSR